MGILTVVSVVLLCLALALFGLFLVLFLGRMRYLFGFGGCLEADAAVTDFRYDEDDAREARLEYYNEFTHTKKYFYSAVPRDKKIEWVHIQYTAEKERVYDPKLNPKFKSHYDVARYIIPLVICAAVALISFALMFFSIIITKLAAR